MSKRERDFGVDVLKCLAALLITNSHMDSLYGDFSFLATGGCIGDTLFFFCSGFALFLKPFEKMADFPNWYKRRIVRIYPSIFAVSIIGGLLGIIQWSALDIILARRYWFISCIMLYYILIYIIGVYFSDKISFIIVIDIVLSAIWFYCIKDHNGFSIYGGHYIRWLLFFSSMLTGAAVGLNREKLKMNTIQDALILIISLVCFYVLYVLGLRISRYSVFQLLSYFPLLLVLVFGYKVVSAKEVKTVLFIQPILSFIKLVGGLCLEIYLVQFIVIKYAIKSLFPLNIIITFFCIVFAAYIVRCLSRFIVQTFSPLPYDWESIVRLF